MKCEETSRATLEGWADLCNVSPYGSDKELRSRIKSSFYFQVASGEIAKPKPEILDITRDFIKERL